MFGAWKFSCLPSNRAIQRVLWKARHGKQENEVMFLATFCSLLFWPLNVPLVQAHFCCTGCYWSDPVHFQTSTWNQTGSLGWMVPVGSDPVFICMSFCKEHKHYSMLHEQIFKPNRMIHDEEQIQLVAIFAPFHRFGVDLTWQRSCGNIKRLNSKISHTLIFTFSHYSSSLINFSIGPRKHLEKYCSLCFIGIIWHYFWLQPSKIYS